MFLVLTFSADWGGRPFLFFIFKFLFSQNDRPHLFFAKRLFLFLCWTTFLFTTNDLFCTPDFQSNWDNIRSCWLPFHLLIFLYLFWVKYKFQRTPHTSTFMYAECTPPPLHTPENKRKRKSNNFINYFPKLRPPQNKTMVLFSETNLSWCDSLLPWISPGLIYGRSQ
jgi:hypothetical protein